MSKPQTQTPVQAAAADLEAAQASLAAMTTERDTAQASLATVTTERDTARASLAAMTTERDAVKAALNKAEAVISRDPDALRIAGAITVPGGTKDGDSLSQEERVKQYNAISSPRERAEFWKRTAPKQAK